MRKLSRIWTRRRFLTVGSMAAIGTLAGCSSQVTAIEGKPLHHTTSGFRNYPPAPEQESMEFSVIWKFFRELNRRPDIPANHIIEESQAITNLNGNSKGASITWIGHTTYLIRLENKTLLLDPFFVDVASPLPIGPKRYIAPGISLENLPRIDAIVISHNHYDHLDAKAVENLPDKEKIAVFAPLGLKRFFTKRGYPNVSELDWWQSAEFEGISLTALPAVHFANRGIGDQNETLWCSWALESPRGSVYFAGDTGYSPVHFKEIGRRFKQFDMAIVPIGAYSPVGVMKPIHTNPEEAIQIANDVKSDMIIPSHWGTIRLTDEPPFEPPERYLDFASKNGISDNRAIIMKIGETRPI